MPNLFDLLNSNSDSPDQSASLFQVLSGLQQKYVPTDDQMKSQLENYYHNMMNGRSKPEEQQPLKVYKL